MSVAGQQLAEIVVGLAVLVVVLLVRRGPWPRRGTSSRTSQTATYCTSLAAQERALVAAAHVADADAGHHDPLAGRRAIVGPQGGGRNKTGQRRGGGRRLEKLAARDAWFHSVVILSQ